MAYTGFPEFVKDFESTWGKEADAKVFVAWKIYTHGLTQGGAEGLTIGLIPNLTQQIKDKGSVFDGGQIFVDERHWKGGDGRWKIFLNDCFIIGGVHSRGEFALVGLNNVVNDKTLVQEPGQLDYVKDPNARYNLKVTQREVLALNSFGYSGGENDNGVRTFTCTAPQLADGARLSRYKSIVDDFDTALRGG